MLLEDLNELVAARVPAQAPERLEHRQVGFAGAVLLHTLSTTDAQGLHEADPGEKRFDQRRLPDPWLPRHEDELPLAIHRPPEHS